jgi:RHS repeat-associated protein
MINNLKEEGGIRGDILTFSQSGQQGAPGLLWQPKTDINATDNHAMKMLYSTNTTGGTPSSMDEKLANNIKRFDINTIATDIDAQEVVVSQYAANQLYVNITIDENGNRSAEAKDKTGQVVAKRVQDKADSFIETNYVYDDFGQLRFVFQPMAEASLSAGTLTPLAATSLIKELTFAYNYDERGRMIQKKVPSAAKVEMVYDQRDRLVFTQDAWGRANNRNRWLYTEYDELNRPLASGYYTQNTDRTTLQAAVNAGNTLGGTKIALTSNTYDAYEGTDASLFGQGETYGQAQLTNLKGMMTKAVTRVVGIDETNPLWDKMLTNVSFYDTKGRPIKTVSTNHTGGQDISVTKIDFTGRAIISKSITNYVKSTSPLVTELVEVQTKNSYDAGGRLLTLCQKINTDNWEQVSKNQYYPLGELKTKGLGCDNSTGSPLALQNVDYEYNIRGWLTDINKIADASMTANKDLFAMKLSYATANSYDGAEVSNTFFNGNIVKQEWNTLRSLSGAEVPSGIQTYDYKYDKLNRLMEGTYSGTLAEGISTTMFDATRGYDKNGNIGYLKRTTGSGVTVMDELIYSYAANQLTTVADGGDATKGFKDKPNAIDYTYDAAGNMITDANKDLSIAYNHLNLPASITRTNSGTNNGVIKHYYAGATKVRMETYDAAGTTLVKAYDYMAGMVYLTTPLSSGEGPGVRSELDFIASSEGRAILTKKVLNLTEDPTTGDKFRFEYSLKDHLGNLRVSCRCGEPIRDAQGVIIPEGQPSAGIEPLAVVQEQHYDAWGLAFSTINQSPITNNQTADRFTYNSKELLNDLDLGWNDYGARMYMSEIGRFGVVDPLADLDHNFSPYTYVYNNPLGFVDHFGMHPDSAANYAPGAVVENNTGGWKYLGDGQWETIWEASNDNNSSSSYYSIFDGYSQTHNSSEDYWGNYLDRMSDRSAYVGAFLSVGTASYKLPDLLRSSGRYTKEYWNLVKKLGSSRNLSRFVHNIDNFGKIGKTGAFAIVGALIDTGILATKITNGTEHASDYFAYAANIAIGVIAISNPVGLAVVATYSVLDATGALDGIQNSLKGTIDKQLDHQYQKLKK